MREQFTFYKSFYRAASRIKDPMARLTFYDTVCSYALESKEPDLDSVPDSVALAFELLQPVLDKARSKAENGAKGGKSSSVSDTPTESKPEANGFVPQANVKQTASKPQNPVSKKEGEEEVEVEKEKEVEIDNKPPTEVCGELPSSPPPAEPDPSPLSIIVIRFPLVDGTEYPFFERQVEELTALYPAVDVPQQLRNMRGWLMANPKNRKTKSGIMRFVTAWLSREQNSARAGNGQTKPGKAQMSYDYAQDPDMQAAIRRMIGGDTP